MQIQQLRDGIVIGIIESDKNKMKDTGGLYVFSPVFPQNPAPYSVIC